MKCKAALLFDHSWFGSDSAQSSWAGVREVPAQLEKTQEILGRVTDQIQQAFDSEVQTFVKDRAEFLDTQLRGIYNDFWQGSAPNFEENRSIPRSELEIFSEGVLGPAEEYPDSYLGKYKEIKDAVVGEAFEKLQTAMETSLEIQDDQFSAQTQSSAE